MAGGWFGGDHYVWGAGFVLVMASFAGGNDGGYGSWVTVAVMMACIFMFVF